MGWREIWHNDVELSLMDQDIKYKVLSHVRTVNARQVAFGSRLGIDVSQKSVGVAWAMIEDLMEREFWGKEGADTPTPKQIALAAKFGFHISQATRRVGDAMINDIMFELNKEAIATQSLKPGVTVTNTHDQLRRPLVISSIADDGTVYFRGGNGARAWARSLIRADTAR